MVLRLEKLIRVTLGEWYFTLNRCLPKGHKDAFKTLSLPGKDYIREALKKVSFLLWKKYSVKQISSRLMMIRVKAFATFKEHISFLINLFAIPFNYGLTFYSSICWCWFDNNMYWMSYLIISAFTLQNFGVNTHFNNVQFNLHTCYSLSLP